MLAPFPVYLKPATASSSSPSTSATMNHSGDNLLDILDLFPISVTPNYEPPSRPPRNPDRLKKLYRRAHPPPTSPLPPLPPSSPDPVSQHLDQVPQPMYPAPGGLSPWSAPLYPSKSIPNPPSPPQSNFMLRGPVGVPLLHAAPGLSSTANPIPNSPRHEYNSSDPALALNVHGGIDTSSRKHHRFKRQEVPYPRSYQRKVVDLDAIDTLLTRQMTGGSLTWHAFPQSWNEPPQQGPLKRILDVGCGDGVWVIEAAKHWKGCEVVGLDIVSLHPDLTRLSRDKNLVRRVSWVQANFLEGLPFANESFDFVHIKRIARGVPEDKWDDLFEEISRVMKPGAAFEVVEEDLSFPGRSDGEGSEVGTLRSKGSNISISTSSLSPGINSRGSSAVGSMRRSLGSARSMAALTTPDSIPSITVNAHSHRSNHDDPSKHEHEHEQPTISISLPPDSLSVTSNNTHAHAFIHRSLSWRQPPSGGRSPELKWPSTPSSPSSQSFPPSPSYQPSLSTPSPQTFHSSPSSQPFPPSSSQPFLSSSSQSMLLSSSNSSTPTPSTMNQTPTPSLAPRPPPSQKSNKAAQAVLMEPDAPFFVGVKPIAGSGSSVSGSVSGSGSSSLFASSIASGFGFGASSGPGNGTSSASSSGSPPKSPVPVKRNKAAQAVLMEPDPPFFVLPQNRSRVSLMGESSSSSSGSSGKESTTQNGKGRSRGSFGSRVSAGLGLNLGFGVKSGTSPSSSVGVGSPIPSPRMLEDELGDGGGSSHSEMRFPVGPPPESRDVGMGAALDSRGVVIGAAPDLGGAVSPLPDLRGVIPPDPRDHTILETIYNEMHAERFINLAPLSLLANTVGLWFTDVRTHPPILLRFPPLREPEGANMLSVLAEGVGVGSSSLGSGAGATRNMNADRNNHSRNTVISLDGLSNGASPYASLDCAISIQRQTRMRALPNPTLDVDLKFLNLHLALRVKEIVACAEAMWEWVSELQTGGMGRTNLTDEVYAKIMALTRPQFDELLLRFELDMREHMSLGSVLEDRFNWSMISGPTPQEKRAFDTACEKWEAYRRLGGGSGDRTPCAVAVATPHPATRLNRILRVFVAWKPTA